MRPILSTTPLSHRYRCLSRHSWIPFSRAAAVHTASGSGHQEARPNWSDRHARLHLTLRQKNLLPRNASVLLAVSGGQDSLALCRLLLDLQPKWGWRLGVAHCDHRWRPDSAANAAHVRQLAATWKLPYVEVVATQDVSSEGAARSWRYQQLQEAAEAGDWSLVATGHTATDRAETLMLNLLRGSGADGLQALAWSRPICAEASTFVVRPLLDFSRADTHAVCTEYGVPVWQDCTNEDVKYRRNRVRADVLPYLREHFNPQVEKALAQTAEVMQAEVEYLECQAAQLLQEACLAASENSSISRKVLRAAPLALQRRAVRQFLVRLGVQGIGFRDVEKFVALVGAPNRTRSDPFGGGRLVVAQVDGDWIHCRPLEAGR